MNVSFLSLACSILATMYLMTPMGAQAADNLPNIDINSPAVIQAEKPKDVPRQEPRAPNRPEPPDQPDAVTESAADAPKSDGDGVQNEPPNNPYKSDTEIDSDSTDLASDSGSKFKHVSLARPNVGKYRVFCRTIPSFNSCSFGANTKPWRLSGCFCSYLIQESSNQLEYIKDIRGVVSSVKVN